MCFSLTVFDLIVAWTGERLLLGEDSPMHRAWLAYCKILDGIAERFNETFSNSASLYGYATFLTVAHYKVKVRDPCPRTHHPPRSRPRRRPRRRLRAPSPSI